MMSDLTPCPNVPPRRRWFVAAWLLLPILAAGAYFRFHRLAEVAYWFDESFCLKMAEFPVGEIFRRSAEDTHPPFYFMLLKAWGMVLGTSPLAARGLSVVCGLATIVGTFLFLQEAYRPLGLDCRSDDGPGETERPSWWGLTAAAFVALSPIHIEWSQSVRMYAMAAMLAVFSALFLMRALRRPGDRWFDWAAFTLIAMALAATHYYGTFTLAAEYLFAAGYLVKRRGAGAPNSVGRRILPLSISAFLVAVEWAALLPAFLNQRQRVMAAFWTKPLDLETLGTTFYQLFGFHEWAAGSSTAGLFIAQAAAVGLLVLAARGRPGDVFVALAASVPLAAAISISLLGRSIVVPRYLLQAHLFLLVGAAVLLCRLPFRPLRVAAVGLAIAGMSFLAFKHAEHRDPMSSVPGMPTAMARFDEARQEGERLIVCNPMLFTSVVAYVRHRSDCCVAAGTYPYFHGTAIMRDDEYFPVNRLAGDASQVVWTLGANGWMGENWEVSLPDEWKVTGDWHFPEYYCEALVLRMYERDKNAMTKSE